MNNKKLRNIIDVIEMWKKDEVQMNKTALVPLFDVLINELQKYRKIKKNIIIKYCKEGEGK